MEIQLRDVGKRFRFEWIFKNFSHDFLPNEHTALLGPNGSGKSTLMKVISGHLSPSAGQITFLKSDTRETIETANIYKEISFAAPYIELIEEFTLTEILDFHSRFKVFQNNLDNRALIEILGFEKSRNKELRFFSSGMKQRLKLALAICSASPILLLDEPTTNLDTQGAAWYREILGQFCKNRTIIVATNTEADYSFFCKAQINVFDYK